MSFQFKFDKSVGFILIFFIYLNYFILNINTVICIFSFHSINENEFICMLHVQL